MPTADSCAAFAKLVAARTRLTELTEEVKQSQVEVLSDGPEARDHQTNLQAMWEEAFLDFVAATKKISTRQT
jgi:hypothetical protein